MDKVKEFLIQSNRIENEISKIADDDALKAWNFIVNKKLTVDNILTTHKILMKNLRPDIAGKVRDCAVWIGGNYKQQQSPLVIKVLLENWIDKYKKPVEAHIKFEYIHPFEDGNGRVGRILYNKQRLEKGLDIDVIHTGKEQQEYYKWFK